MIEDLEQFFKAEARSAGARYFSQSKVNLARTPETQVQAYIQGMTSTKITLQMSFDSPTISADCTCPVSKKGQLCKHIWATLLTTQDQRPEFLEGKTEIEKSSSDSTPTTFSKAPQRTLSQSQIDSRAAYKEKQSDYRKLQYQKQKNMRLNKKALPALSESVQFALDFFSENGFGREELQSVEDIQLAKKKLYRVFHPDVGGKHEDILEMNRYTEVLLSHVQAKGKL